MHMSHAYQSVNHFLENLGNHPFSFLKTQTNYTVMWSCHWIPQKLDNVRANIHTISSLIWQWKPRSMQSLINPHQTFSSISYALSCRHQVSILYFWKGQAHGWIIHSMHLRTLLAYLVSHHLNSQPVRAHVVQWPSYKIIIYRIIFFELDGSTEQHDSRGKEKKRKSI